MHDACFPSLHCPIQGGLEPDEGPLREIQRLVASVRGSDGSTLTVLERVAIGSRGSVFLARLGGVEVAVKSMLFKGAEGTARASAEWQARLGAACSISLVHPNVVGVNGVIKCVIGHFVTQCLFELHVTTRHQSQGADVLGPWPSLRPCVRPRSVILIPNPIIPQALTHHYEVNAVELGTLVLLVQVRERSREVRCGHTPRCSALVQMMRRYSRCCKRCSAAFDS